MAAMLDSGVHTTVLRVRYFVNRGAAWCHFGNRGGTFGVPPAKFPCVVLLCAARGNLCVAVAVVVFRGYPVRSNGCAMAVTKNELRNASGVWPARTGIDAECWQGLGPAKLPESFAAAEQFYCCMIERVQPLGAQSQFCVPFAVGSQHLFKLQSGNACVAL